MVTRPPNADRPKSAWGGYCCHVRRVALVVRLCAAGVACVAVTALAGCTAHPGHGDHRAPSAERGHAVAKGVVTGFAAACTGPVGITSSRPVTVFAVGSRGFMARQTIVDGGTYRMRLPAGRYELGLARSATVTQRILVRAGQTTVVNFPNVCD
jgi:hypothetical protein